MILVSISIDESKENAVQHLGRFKKLLNFIIGGYNVGHCT
ncbi:hypothetical protein RAMDARK_1932 [Rickettsia amblyommatis str. Darkwater]|nr:hypothetical protein RAMDARK_1932 [Rickettsia amblyommatis str. Darkwater]